MTSPHDNTANTAPRSLVDRFTSPFLKGVVGVNGQDGKKTPNYLSLAIGHGRAACQPAIEQWAAWAPYQRIMAVCLVMPFIAGPLITLAVFAPLLLALTSGGYIVAFGLDTSQQHYQEAVKEHFGVDAITLDGFRKQADELRKQAEGNQYVQAGLQYIGYLFSQLLVAIVFCLDHVIAVIVFLFFLVLLLTTHTLCTYI